MNSQLTVTTPVSMKDGWDALIGIERQLRSIIARVAGSSRVDDAWSEVVIDRLEGVLATYNPSKGSLQNHLRIQMRWYVYKWAHTSRAAKVKRATASLTNVDVAVYDDQDGCDVQLMVEELEPYDRWVLTQHYLNGYSIPELAASAGVSIGAMKKSLAQALSNAREVVLYDETAFAGRPPRL